jgi:hypothetical protein
VDEPGLIEKAKKMEYSGNFTQFVGLHPLVKFNPSLIVKDLLVTSKAVTQPAIVEKDYCGLIEQQR